MNLYFLGGVPRVGKSTIAMKFIKQRPMPVVAADAITEGIRNIFCDDPFRILNEVKISGHIKYKDQQTQGLKTEELDEHPQHENSLTLRALLGVIDYHRREQSDLLIEGCIFDPDWIHRHNFEGFNVHAVYVGFSDEAHIAEIIKHARQNPGDWINELLKRHNGDEGAVREKLRPYIEKSDYLATEAPRYGYHYFDLSAKPFDEYVDEVVGELLKAGVS